MNPLQNTSQTTRRASLGSRGPHIALERRASPRLPAVDGRAWTGWWINDDEFTMTASRIENISRGGARIRSAFEPDVLQDLWIRVANPLCNEHVQATVLEVVPAPEGDFWVRLSFSEPCPDFLFDTVTQGPATTFPGSPQRSA